MTESQYLSFVDYYQRFVEAELAHVEREVSELDEYRRGERTSDKPLGSVFFANAGSRLQQLITAMEHWGISDSN